MVLPNPLNLIFTYLKYGICNASEHVGRFNGFTLSIPPITSSNSLGAAVKISLKGIAGNCLNTT